MDEAVTLVVAAALAVEALAGMIAGGYIALVYWQRHEDSEYLRRLVLRDWRVAVGCAWIAVFVVYSLGVFVFGWAPMPRPWGALAIAVPIAVFMWGVISDAIQFHRDRAIGTQKQP